MAWRNFLAVVFQFFAFGCAPDLPIDYWVSASCAPGEIEAIKKAALSWNSASCVEVLMFGGIFEDKIFEIEDIQDEKLVVYCLDNDENPDANKFLSDKYQGHAAGDILLKRKVKRIDVSPEMFKGLAAHEFGHKLGLGHMDYPGVVSVMRFDPKDISLRPFSPALVDIYGNGMVGGLCGRINCPAECQTKPKV